MERRTERLRSPRGWEGRIRRRAAGTIVTVGCALAAAGADAATEKHAITSATLKRTVTIVVDTPPEYDGSKDRYAAVYTLIGDAKGRSPRARSKIGDDARGRGVRPIVFVHLDQLSGAAVPHDAASLDTLERVMLEEIIPFVEGRYRTIPSHEGRALVCMSGGAVGALMLAFKHPHFFSSVVSFVGDMPEPPSAAAAAAPTNAAAPGAAPPALDPSSLWRLLETNGERIAEHLRLGIVCGDQADKACAASAALKVRAEAAKVPVTWMPGPTRGAAGHDGRDGVDALAFVDAGFSGPQSPREGVARDLTYWSESNRRNIWIKVYTPPGYDAGSERYPVVYNLHGAGGGSPQRQWKRAGATLKDAIENSKVRPLVYVFVNGMGDTFFLDYEDGSVKAETAIVSELIPFIDGRYRTIASAGGRAIDGFSMGGGGAMRIALRHPELFSSVVSYGGALIRADPRRPNQSRFGSEEYVARNNPWALIEANANRVRERLRIRMVCGDQDGLFQANVEFKDLAAKLKIPVEWVAVAGVAHDTRGLYVRVGLESVQFIEAGLPPRRASR